MYKTRAECKERLKAMVEDDKELFIVVPTKSANGIRFLRSIIGSVVYLDMEARISRRLLALPKLTSVLFMDHSGNVEVHMNDAPLYIKVKDIQVDVPQAFLNGQGLYNHQTGHECGVYVIENVGFGEFYFGMRDTDGNEYNMDPEDLDDGIYSIDLAYFKRYTICKTTGLIWDA